MQKSIIQPQPTWPTSLTESKCSLFKWNMVRQWKAKTFLLVLFVFWHRVSQLTIKHDKVTASDWESSELSSVFSIPLILYHYITSFLFSLMVKKKSLLEFVLKISMQTLYIFWTLAQKDLPILFRIRGDSLLQIQLIIYL